MAKLTKDERKSWQERLSRWQTPEEMQEAVRELCGALHLDMLIQAGISFAREAWIAAKFGADHGAAAVRIVPEEWPDIETRDASGVHQFEIVEADVPGRKRTKEFKEAAEKIKRGESTLVHTPEDMQDRSALVDEAIQAATEKKVEKRYGARCSLIIMLNFGGEYGIGAEAVGAILHSATADARSAFDEVWLLWRDDAYLLWQNGERVKVEIKQGYVVL